MFYFEEGLMYSMDFNRTIPGQNGQNGQHNNSEPTFTTPPPLDFSSEDMRGSIQKILSENTGEYVVIEFLIGTCEIMRKQGILYFVGTSYVALYDDIVNNYILFVIFSIKFVYFYYPIQRPRQNFNLLPGARLQ